MKRVAVWAVVLAGVPCAASRAQMHVVKDPDKVVRAVGVFEWTGEEAKPTASRLVPVTVFIDGQLQDAGVYLARPVPFALGTGTVFEVRKAGVDEGTLELAYARHRVTQSTGSYDDGWFAVGAFKPKPEEKVAKLKAGPVAKIEVSGGSGSGPKLKTPDGNAAEKTGSVDRSTAAGAGTTVSADKDPDAPTMRRRTETADASPADAGSADDPAERPTLKRRETPTQTKAAQKKKDQASVTSEGDLNDDPDRPSLHRGVPTSRMDEENLPPLVGIPAGMKQEVAVSDAKDRPQHDFKRDWENDAERAEVTGAMEAVARAQLAKYGDALAGTAVPSAKTAAVRSAAGRPVARKKVAAAPAAGATALSDETLQGYTLSYGGAPTFVLQASSPGAVGVARYVTVVAQREPAGTLKVATASVTDAAHLDRTPWMRLVDAVDVEASNRASLLFELRAQTTRQFALYRVMGAQADQVFVTEPAE